MKETDRLKQKDIKWEPWGVVSIDGYDVARIHVDEKDEMAFEVQLIRKYLVKVGGEGLESFLETVAKEFQEKME